MTKPVTSLSRTISGAILGDSVTQVLAQTEALVLAGAERSAVNRANDATVVLRDLLTRYNELTTDEERYMFYITCYEQLRFNFCALLRTLDYFYDYDLVRMEIKRRNRVEQYEILLAQLYYLCNALENNPVGNYIHEYKTNKTGAYYYDSAYRIGSGKRTPAAVVGADGVLEDKNNALPLDSGYPNLPAEPVLPTPVTDPGNPPAPPRDPGAPPPSVADPGSAPKTVEKPTMPEKVDEPTAPTAYKPTEMESALAGAFEKGELKERILLDQSFFFVITAQVVKYFRNAQTVTIYFHLNRDEPLSDYAYVVESADIGSYVKYEGKEPKAEEREGYEYSFDGWMDGAGNLIDLNRLALPEGISGDLHLYPHFNEIPISCTVVWSVDGNNYYSTCAYGAQPMYDEDSFGALAKERPGVRLYRFIGWKHGNTTYAEDELPCMATRITVYTAVFEESYVVTWSIAGDILRAPVWRGEVPEYGKIPEKAVDSRYRYTFSGWDKPIAPAVGDVTYTAIFDAEYLIGFSGGGSSVSWLEEEGAYAAGAMNVGASPISCAGLFELAALKNAGVIIAFSGGKFTFSIASVRTVSASGMQKLTIDVMQTGTNRYRFGLNFTDGAGKIVALDCGVQINASGVFDADNSYLVAKDGAGTVTEINSGVFVTESEINFTLNPGIRYELYPQYAVGIMPLEHMEIFASCNRAGAGERVELAFGALPAGMFMRSVYIRAENGEEIAFDGTGFTMPACAVTVGVGLDWLEYQIVFKSEGKTLVTRTLPYGAEILPPSDPVKASDDTYEYTFAGWDKPLGTVTGDVEFHAVFTESPLPERITPETALTKIIRFAYVAVPVYLVLLLGIMAALIVLRIRASKNSDTVPTKAQSSNGNAALAHAPIEEVHALYPQLDENADPAPMYGLDGDFCEPAPSEAVPDPLVVAAFPQTDVPDAPKSHEE